MIHKNFENKSRKITTFPIQNHHIYLHNQLPREEHIQTSHISRTAAQYRVKTRRRPDRFDDEDEEVSTPEEDHLVTQERHRGKDVSLQASRVANFRDNDANTYICVKFAKSAKVDPPTMTVFNIAL